MKGMLVAGMVLAHTIQIVGDGWFPFHVLSETVNLVAFSVFNGNIVGQVFAMLVLTVAAAEAAVGLAILVVYFRNRGQIEVEDVNVLRG